MMKTHTMKNNKHKKNLILINKSNTLSIERRRCFSWSLLKKAYTLNLYEFAQKVTDVAVARLTQSKYS